MAALANLEYSVNALAARRGWNVWLTVAAQAGFEMVDGQRHGHFALGMAQGLERALEFNRREGRSDDDQGIYQECPPTRCREGASVPGGSGQRPQSLRVSSFQGRFLEVLPARRMIRPVRRAEAGSALPPLTLVSIAYRGDPRDAPRGRVPRRAGHRQDLPGAARLRPRAREGRPGPLPPAPAGDQCGAARHRERDRLALVLGLTAMTCRSELAALNLGDVSETDDGLELTIRMGKTDQEALGEVVLVHAAATPRPTRSVSIAPDRPAARERAAHRVAAVRRRPARLDRRPLFPSSRQRHRAPRRRAGRPRATRAGRPNAISRHGRWAENSPVVPGYIRAADKWKDNPFYGRIRLYDCRSLSNHSRPGKSALSRVVQVSHEIGSLWSKSWKAIVKP